MEYVPALERLKGEMRKVVQVFAAHVGQKESSLLMTILKSQQPRLILIDPEADIKAGKYDQWMQALSNAWPDDLEWPADVPRPPKTVDASDEGGN